MAIFTNGKQKNNRQCLQTFTDLKPNLKVRTDEQIKHLNAFMTMKMEGQMKHNALWDKLYLK